MSITPLDSGIFAGFLADKEAAELLSDKAEIAAMLRFEGALAQAQAETGVIPEAAAAEIATLTKSIRIDPADLSAGTARDGLPVPALAAVLRGALSPEAASFVHWGATSQDVIDTALVLRLKGLMTLYEDRITTVGAQLAGLAEEHSQQAMLGRTRMQQAVPTTFGLKAAGWLSSLTRQRERLRQLKPRLLKLSFAGASGTLSALGGRGMEVEAALAKRLDLNVAALPWHTQRDSILELGGWLSQSTVALGKMGQDLVLLAQNEVGEVRLQGGGSSTMPNKVNPIAAEVLVTLARFNAAQVGLLHQAGLQEQERGGAGWTLEWLTLPPMLMATAVGFSHAEACLEGLLVQSERMQANLQSALSLPLAELASFRLSEEMPRDEAKAVVKAACETALEEGRDLLEVLAATSGCPEVDWQALRDHTAWLGASGTFIERALKDWREG